MISNNRPFIRPAQVKTIELHRQNKLDGAKKKAKFADAVMSALFFGGNTGKTEYDARLDEQFDRYKMPKTAGELTKRLGSKKNIKTAAKILGYGAGALLTVGATIAGATAAVAVGPAVGIGIAGLTAFGLGVNCRQQESNLASLINKTNQLSNRAAERLNKPKPEVKAKSEALSPTAPLAVLEEPTNSQKLS